MEKYSIVNPEDANLAGVAALRKELATLEKRAKKQFDCYDDYILPIHVVLTIVIGLIVGIATKNVWAVIATLFFYGWIPGLLVTWIVAGIPFLLFKNPIEQYWLEWRSKSKWHSRLTHLKYELERIEKIEEQVFSSSFALVNRLESFHNGTIRELFGIRYYFSRKKKWYDAYRTYENRLLEIIDRAETTVGEIDDHRNKVSGLPERLTDSFNMLRAGAVRETESANRLLGQLEAMKDWISPVRTNSRLSSGEASETLASRPATPRETRPTIAQSEDSSDEYDFSQPETIKQPIVVAPPSPPKRRVLNRQLKKIPFDDYVGAAEAKMTVGALGEIIVLHYEIRRVEEESSRYGSHQVSRVSEDSNSLGYDIESFSQGEKVFIEVKSTTGTFWTDFYLTANERDVMQTLGERYWLYRIFEMSKEDGSAKLSVFRGKSSIEASFELEAMNFKMNPKAGTITDGTLPFETVE